jgi:cell shape-determining protein MreC
MAISPSPFDRVSRRQRQSRRPLLWVGVLLFCVVLAFAVAFRNQASSVFWYVVSPVMRTRTVLENSEAVRLRAELASTSAALADRNALYRENIDLKERLGRSVSGTRLLAAILQGPPWVPYDTLLIDAGAMEGVVVGDLVAASGQAFIGRVSEVYAHQSRVVLLSAPGETYQALLRGTIPLAVEGQGGGSMRAEVPAGTEVHVGDDVQFPGLMPAMAGKVSATEVKEGESFIVVFMRLPVNVAELRFVEVTKS